METVDKQSIIRKFETEVVRQQERLKVVDEKIEELQKELGLSAKELNIESVQGMVDKVEERLKIESEKLEEYLKEYEQLG